MTFHCQRKYLLCLMAVAILLASCGSSRKQPISYLGLRNDSLPVASDLTSNERRIQKGDLLSIVIYSDNPAATSIYNQPVISLSNATNAGGNAGITTASTAGYLVDENGEIQFQSLGSLKVEGLTRKTLSDTLVAKLSVYLANPYCAIRLLNYKITVMGEVVKPSSYNIPSERVTVLEAIGMAGDITLYGRKDNVKVLRETNGKRTVGELDLRDPNIFRSEYYFLQQNDLVIVDQLKNKQQASDQVTVRNISILATIVSTLAIVFSAIRK